MTPLVLFVGFLGAGKTTVLKHLVPVLAEAGIRPGLLINDYQNARVDAEQFRELIDEVRAVSGDCVCCGSRDQFFAELGNFQHDGRRVMLVETNGTTDPGPLIEALSLDPSLTGFSLPLQVSVVDAKRWQKRFWHNRLEREQVRTASHVLLTRADEVAAERRSEVERSLADLGTGGRMVNVGMLAAELIALADELSGAQKRIIGGGDEPGHAGHDHHHHGHDEHHHHEEHHFASEEFALPEVVSRAPFARFLRELAPEVVRAKGLVRFHEDPENFFVFQKVDDDIQYFPVGPSPRLQTPLLLLVGPHPERSKLAERIAAL
ncbi:MAG: GTP-binding protein [Terrimicrobiaceae bacterium]|nr:GTP-binding protein [Terrimicrobiaceae bacterium]